MVDYVTAAIVITPYLVAFILGFGILPLSIMLLGSGYPDLVAGATARLCWTLGMFVMGAAVVYQRAGQHFAVLAADRERSGDALELVADVDGNEVRAIGDEGDLGRLGKHPTGFAAEKDPQMLKRLGATRSPDDLAGTVRQGYQTFIPWEDGEHEWFLPLRRQKAKLLDSAGTDVIDHAEEEAIVDAGGMSQLSPVMFTIASLLALLLGAAMSLVSMLVVT
jgi:hypothetical protein